MDFITKILLRILDIETEEKQGAWLQLLTDTALKRDKVLLEIVHNKTSLGYHIKVNNSVVATGERLHIARFIRCCIRDILSEKGFEVR